MTTNTASTSKNIRYMDMGADELKAAYWFQRGIIDRYGKMAQLPPGNRYQRSQMATRVFRAWDRLDLIANVARKRGIDLLAN